MGQEGRRAEGRVRESTSVELGEREHGRFVDRRGKTLRVRVRGLRTQ